MASAWQARGTKWDQAGEGSAKGPGARIGRPEASVDRLALVQGIRGGASVSELARRFGVSRPTIRKLVSAQVEKRVASDGATFEAIAAPGAA